MLLLLRVGISDQTLHLTPPPPPPFFALHIPPYRYLRSPTPPPPPPPGAINNNKYALHWRRRDTNTLPGKSRENSKIWFGNKTWSQYFISHTIHALFCLLLLLLFGLKTCLTSSDMSPERHWQVSHYQCPWTPNFGQRTESRRRVSHPRRPVHSGLTPTYRSPKPAHTSDRAGHGCVVNTERAEIAAVSRGTSHVTINQRCKYTTSVYIFKNVLLKASLSRFGLAVRR